MAVIKNLVTGVVTECNNNDVIRICKADAEHYKVTEKKVMSTDTPKKATAKKK